jgi:hypothetical protein
VACGIQIGTRIAKRSAVKTTRRSASVSEAMDGRERPRREEEA